MSREQQIIERAGGKYLGVQDGLAWFNEPETRTTMTVTLRAIHGLMDPEAVELVRILMAEKRREFEEGLALTLGDRGTPSPLLDSVGARRDSSSDSE